MEVSRSCRPPQRRAARPVSFSKVKQRLHDDNLNLTYLWFSLTFNIHNSPWDIITKENFAILLNNVSFVLNHFLNKITEFFFSIQHLSIHLISILAFTDPTHYRNLLLGNRYYHTIECCLTFNKSMFKNNVNTAVSETFPLMLGEISKNRTSSRIVTLLINRNIV